MAAKRNTRKPKRAKFDWELTIQERIDRAGWFQGTMEKWQALPREEKQRIAFAATGCQVASPSWQMPVECSHITCVIARGDKPPIALVNSQLRGEKTNWLRFILQEQGAVGRRKVAAIFRHCRAQARETGVMDIWKNGWQAIVFPAVLPEAK